METKTSKSPANSKARKIRRIVTAAAVLLVLIFFVYGFFMQTVSYTIDSGKIDSPLRVVFISDLHNCFYGGTDQSALMKEIDKYSPDLVLFGGDVIDMYGGTQHALTIMSLASEKYSCCYSPGNHEMMRDDYADFREDVTDLGITVLEGGLVSFEIKGQQVNVLGAVDAVEGIPDSDKPFITQLDSCIELSERTSGYNILLAHQPELIDYYLEGEFDLILSGHAHGGQWRIPYILDQGLYAPDQGIRPAYTNGIYYYGETVHIISKGLAKPLRMIFIPRIFNHPEFTVIDIE